MSRATLLAFLGALAVANLSVYLAVCGSETLRVERLALAKGDATLVRFPDGEALLIDAGADASIVRALGMALPPWERRLAALVLLTSDAGASGGAPYVLASYRTGMLLRSSYLGPAGREAALASALAQSKTPVRDIPRGSAGLVLRYQTLSLPLSSSTPAGAYPIK